MSGIGTGLDGQIGIAAESTYGTFVAPSTFFEFNNASVTPQVERLVSNALGRGAFRRAPRIEHFITGGEGPVGMDLVNKGLGLWLKHMLGTVVTSQPDDVGQPNHYVHTFTPDVQAWTALSLTTQLGIPPTDGPIEPFTGLGGVVTSWEISGSVNEIATINPTLDYKTVTTAETLATPSYPSGLRSYTFLGGSLTMDGSSVGVLNSISLSGAQAANTDRRGFGNTKHRPLANDFWAYTGTFESEFDTRDAYDAWVAGVEQVNLVITFEVPGSEIDAGQGNPYKCVLTIPSLHYTGDAPSVDGPDVVSQSRPFEAAVNEAGDDIIKIEYHTDEATV